MKLQISFIGKAERLAEQYEGVQATSFVVRLQDPPLSAMALPQLGDVVTLRMHPGPDIHNFRCAGRHFDFSIAAAPVLHVLLDMD